MDFGLALTKGSRRVTYSNLSITMGTPDYMAPEQIEGQRGDQRTDIYALGIIFYEILTGETPFTGDTNMAVMAQHLNNTALRVDHVNPIVPAELAAVVARCLARKPENRYQDIPALINALDYPESVDLSILNTVAKTKPSSKSSLVQSQVFRAIGISILMMIAIVVLAFVLQALR
jgi:serine/threonine-protein kinase